MIVKKLPYSKDAGLLVLRVGIGAMFVLHGLPKIQGGPEKWERLAQFALPFLPEGTFAVALGLCAAVAELGGGFLLIIGAFHRPVCAVLAGTMAVAFSTKLGAVNNYANFAKEAGWPLELLIVFVALFLLGPGRFCCGRSH